MNEIEEIIINSEVVKLVTSKYDDDFIITEPRTIISSCRPQTLLEKVTKNISVDEILPKNCRYIKKNTDGYLLIIEEDPQIRTISSIKDITYDLENHKKTGKFEEYGLEVYENIKPPYRFTLSFPFIVYFIKLDLNMRFTNMRLFFRLHPITSLSDYLLKPCLPNVNIDYLVCLNSNFNPNDHTIESKVNTLIDSFWFNHFNADYYDLMISYSQVPQICDFFTWQHNTKIDPLFIFSTKWIQANSTVNEFIENSQLNVNSLYYYQLKNTIDNMGMTENKIDFDPGTNSIVYKNHVLTSGDTVEINDDEKYYINSFKNDKVYLEKYPNYEEVTLPIEVFHEKIKEKLETITSLDSVKIAENYILNKNDLLFFNETSTIASVNEIIQLRDGTINIKINNDFYLLNNFLNQKIQKFDENIINFQNRQIIKNNVYAILDKDYSNKIFNKVHIKKYTGIEKDKRYLYLKFESENDQDLLIRLNHFSERYEIIDIDELIYEEVFRINNEIYTNSNENIHFYLSKERRGIVYHCIDSTKSTSLNMYDKNICKQYFEQICQNNDESFTIKSFDKDISYSINDEVITINWDNPEEMFNIKRIIAFCMEDETFCLKLKDDQNNETNYPIVRFYEKFSKNYFATVRKVVRSMDQYKVGMKIKAMFKSIPDFPMKDCNQIKAFVIDDIRPLVLLSNFRTLLLESLQNFKCFESDSIDISPPSFPIRHQDCDVYIDRDIEDVYALSNNSKIKAYITLSKRYSFANSYGFTNNSLLLRYGLIHPRFLTSKIFELPLKYGISNDYGNIVETKSTGVVTQLYRTDWSIM